MGATSFVLLLCLLLSIGCTRSGAEEQARTTDNSELAQLFERDQAERAAVEKGADEATRDALERNNRERQERLEAIIEQGEVRTAIDHYHAAMLMQHGDSTTAYGRAFELARRAVTLDSTHQKAKQLMAMSWDRYLMSRGKPQWYGTQYVREGETYRLYEVDTVRITDAERRRLGVPTLEEARARAERMP